MNLTIFRNFGRIFASSTRSYAFKSDLKIKWNRPEKISCLMPEKSGDLGKLQKLDERQTFIPEFQNSAELKEAEESVQKLFRLEFNPRVYTSRLHREIMIKEVQRHKLDYGSMEVKIARMTATIRRFQEYREKFPRHRHINVMLKEIIDKRKKFLKYLRRWDYKRFEWLLNKLDLVYKPPPAEFHWITRKDSLRKLTDQHCENIKEERLNEFRNELRKQQIPFLEKKLKNLEFVRNEQQQCKVEVTISEGEIKQVKKQLEELKKKRDDELKKNIEND